MTGGAMTRIFDGRWYGPPDEPGSLRDEMATDADPAVRLRYAVARCKQGEFSGRAAIFEMLNADPDHELSMDALSVALAVASAEDLMDPDNITFLPSADLDKVFALAGGGGAMLATTALPLLLMLFDEEQELPDEIREQAFSSIRSLLGSDLPISEDSDASTIAEHAQMRIDAIDANYILAGAPAVPAPFAKRMTASAYRALELGTPFTNTGTAELLSVWSGIPCPIYANELVTAEQVALLVQYVSRIADLPWQPGHKYFYGHDVDGGPGLR